MRTCLCVHAPTYILYEAVVVTCVLSLSRTSYGSAEQSSARIRDLCDKVDYVSAPMIR